MNESNVECNMKWCEVLSHVLSLCSWCFHDFENNFAHTGKINERGETKMELKTLLNADNKAIKNDNVEMNQMSSELNFHKLPWILGFYGCSLLNCTFGPWICYLLILVEIAWIPFEYWNSFEVVRKNININDASIRLQFICDHIIWRLYAIRIFRRIQYFNDAQE